MKIGVVGANGRMGQELLKLIKNQSIFEMSHGLSAINKSGLILNNFELTNNLEDVFKVNDIIIEFTNQKTTYECLNLAAIYKKKLVSGTTGLDESIFNLMHEFSKKTAIFWSSNFSLGIYVLNKLTSIAMNIFDDEYDINIIETHHKNKLDAPSGTALTLKNQINKFGRKVDLNSIRSGNCFGEHKIIFTGLNEKLSLKHTSFNRSHYAKGALKAAIFLNDYNHGLFTMDDLFAEYDNFVF